MPTYSFFYALPEWVLLQDSWMGRGYLNALQCVALMLRVFLSFVSFQSTFLTLSITPYELLQRYSLIHDHTCTHTLMSHNPTLSPRLHNPTPNNRDGDIHQFPHQTTARHPTHRPRTIRFPVPQQPVNHPKGIFQAIAATATYLGLSHNKPPNESARPI